MTDIQQAREWAENGAVKVNSGEVIDEIAKSAVRVIQSLPGHWIDADKVREVLDRWAENPFPTSDEVAVLNDFEALLTPPLPTLAELIEAGNEPEGYQWAWVDTEDGLQVISMAGNFDDEQVYTMDKDGYRFAKGWSEIRPRSDLPKLEWPGSAPDDVAYATGGALTTQDVVDECRTVRKERALPRPEDVPDPQPGEAWLIEYRGKRYEALFWYSELYAHWTFGMGRKGTFTVESPEATPIARLVPEVKP